MTKNSRYLITTADERTWKFDRPVIFLGEWCRLYNRRHVWQGMDAIVASPYGLGKVMKDADHAEARALEEKLFPVLCMVLNEYHGTQHDSRFWKIVLGHWFRRYVDVMLNRVKTLEQCFRSHQITGITVFSDEHYTMATQDSNSAIWAFNDARWNNALHARILPLLGTASFPVEIIAGDTSEGFFWQALKTDVTIKGMVLKWGFQLSGKFSSVMGRDNDAFILKSYLPKKEEIKLQLALGQLPQIWDTQTVGMLSKIDRLLRQSLTGKMIFKLDGKLENVLRAMIFEMLPVCYLESFNHLNKMAQQLPWPKKPKLIFTSNNFDTDELFKIWAAKKIELGSQYVVGQHGNSYGTYCYMYPSVEEATADKFITWGWRDELAQHTPAFILKAAGKNTATYDPEGGLLLIEDMCYHQLDTWDRMYENQLYFTEQICFIGKLLKNIKHKLTVRLHSSYIYLKPFEVDLWRDLEPDLKIDTGMVAMRQLISKSRLVVHSYDSTGILETLSQNIPTLAFWQNNFDHLRESAKPYYQQLVDAGIVHLTPDSVALKVNEIWNDVEGWWGGNKVQEARKQFCDRYARVNQYPVRELKNILSR